MAEMSKSIFRARPTIKPLTYFGRNLLGRPGGRMVRSTAAFYKAVVDYDGLPKNEYGAICRSSPVYCMSI